MQRQQMHQKPVQGVRPMRTCAMLCYDSRTTQRDAGGRQRVPAGHCQNALGTLLTIQGPPRPSLYKVDAGELGNVFQSPE
eukprot:7486790-Pyramimonas_sp.AAC.1